MFVERGERDGTETLNKQEVFPYENAIHAFF